MLSVMNARRITKPTEIKNKHWEAFTANLPDQVFILHQFRDILESSFMLHVFRLAIVLTLPIADMLTQHRPGK